mmetsp:Transcript_38236/g.110326  ORF Transcript_38236/g.110326 Transcript_38236/m.110326 type:complete len:221 (+) Transcript_38236:793-1455(+)
MLQLIQYTQNWVLPLAVAFDLHKPIQIVPEVFFFLKLWRLTLLCLVFCDETRPLLHRRPCGDPATTCFAIASAVFTAAVDRGDVRGVCGDAGCSLRGGGKERKADHFLPLRLATFLALQLTRVVAHFLLLRHQTAGRVLQRRHGILHNDLNLEFRDLPPVVAVSRARRLLVRQGAHAASELHLVPMLRDVPDPGAQSLSEALDMLWRHLHGSLRDRHSPV